VAVDRAREREPEVESQEARELAPDLVRDCWDRKALLVEFQVSRSKTLANPLDLFPQFHPARVAKFFVEAMSSSLRLWGNCS
jgi:hypothetical protein